MIRRGRCSLGSRRLLPRRASCELRLRGQHQLRNATKALTSKKASVAWAENGANGTGGVRGLSGAGGVDTCLIRSTPFETHVGGLLHRHPALEPTGPATPSVPPASSKLPSPEIHSSAVAQGNARAPSPTPGRCSHSSAPPVCARKADPQARWPSTGCGQRLLRFVRSFTDETDPRLLFL